MVANKSQRSAEFKSRSRMAEKRGFEVCMAVAQQLGEWFPIRSVGFNLSQSQLEYRGEFELVRTRSEKDGDQTVRFTIMVDPHSEGITSNDKDKDMPFVYITANDRPHEFNSMAELHDQYLGSREKFMDAMNRDGLPCMPLDSKPGNARQRIVSQRLDSTNRQHQADRG